MKSESRKLPRMAGPSDSIMMTVRSNTALQAVPVRRSYEIKIPHTNAFDPYPSPTLFSQNLCKRINVLRPIPPDRRTVFLETEDQHAFINHCKIEKERQMRERFHNAYSRYYYGDSINKEIYRKYLRESLKQQMIEKDSIMSINQKMKQSESVEAVRRDQADLEKDLFSSRQRSEFLRQYRDGNKTLMEESMRRKKDELIKERQYEKQILQFNPINWSATLK